jgi:hypothetical protein
MARVEHLTLSTGQRVQRTDYEDTADVCRVAQSGAPWLPSPPPSDLMSKMLHGDLASVGDTSKLLEGLEQPHAFRRRFVAAPAGGSVNVRRYQAYCEGVSADPAIMRRRAMTSDQTSPIKIAFACNFSAAVSDDQLKARALAITALAEIVAGARPLTLLLVTTSISGNEIAVQTVPLGVTPLDVAMANVWIGRADMVNSKVLIRERAAYLGVSFYPLRADQTAIAREALGLAPQDVFIPPAYYRDPISLDPLAWIADNAARLNAIEPE